MTHEQGAWQVVELSAKSNGNKWGERAGQGKQHVLAFLFVAPDKVRLSDSLLHATMVEVLTKQLEMTPCRRC